MSPFRRNVEVDVQVNRIKVVSIITLALERADYKKFEDAKLLLKKAIKEIVLTGSFVQKNALTHILHYDLCEALKRIQSVECFQQGGRAWINESLHESFTQRSCFPNSKKRRYYTSSSSEMQKRERSSEK